MEKSTVAQVAAQGSSLLGTANLRLILEPGITKLLRALCDPGSQVNLITDACVKAYSLPRQRATAKLLCADGITGMKVKGLTTVTICNRFNKDAIKRVQFNIVSKLPQILPAQSLTSVEDESLYADTNWNKPSPIDILIGVGVWADIIKEKKIRLINGLVKLDTQLGQVVFGESQTNRESDELCGMLGHEETLSDIIGKLWEMEGNPEPKPMSANDEWCEENYRKTHSRSPTGRYIVTIPLNPEDQQLGESKWHYVSSICWRVD